MGTDDFFKKRKQAAKERKYEVRPARPNSFLIVSEGTKTEPFYFDGLAEYINHEYESSINVAKPQLDIHGEGKCTVSLVEAAANIDSRAHIVYGHRWVVFDKDDFNDFDEAIKLANSYGFKVAWSNQCFEYWVYLHFHYSDSALHRDDWFEKLDMLFKNLGIVDGYKKNNEDIFNIATTRGSLKYAIANAIRMELSHNKYKKPSQCDPCTNVHNLILELQPYISKLL
ncbi:MAG: RloB family protein [Bacillota bacterium]